VLEGSGQATAGSGAFSVPVSFPRRIGEAQGVTSPEELIATAHATCYAMALNATLGRKNGSAERTHIVCKVSADKGDSGIKITTSHLTITVHGLKGVTAEEFAEVAKAANGGCPVSNALKGSVAVELETHVK
jgi:osmotically inducible protein OsmC